MKLSLNHLTASNTVLPTERNTQLTHNAQKLVGQTFFGTLLKQMHNSPFKSKMFDGGRGGEAFQTMMDQHLIDRMSHSAGKKLVKSIVKHIVRGQEARATGASFPTDHNASTPQSFSQGSASTPFSKKNRGDAKTEMRPRVPVGLRA